MNFGIKKQVLLTGAGFTFCAGGFSGKQMRTRLFNDAELKKDSNLFDRITSEFADYESIYREVVESRNFSESQRKIMIEAYERAYLQLDRSICKTCVPSYQPLNLNRLATGLLDYFAGDRTQRERGHIFTLNQDLFLERGYVGTHILTQPGIRSYHNFDWIPMDDERSQDHIRIVPAEEKVEKHKEEDERPLSSSGELQYIKLHGSMNWRERDGSMVMVIAGHKIEHILTACSVSGTSPRGGNAFIRSKSKIMPLQIPSSRVSE